MTEARTTDQPGGVGGPDRQPERTTDRRTETNTTTERGPVYRSPIVAGAVLIGLLILAAVALNKWGGSGQQQAVVPPPGGQQQVNLPPAPIPTPTQQQTTADESAKRAKVWADCEQQAAARRALGIPSQAQWIGPRTCEAKGGFTESGRI